MQKWFMLLSCGLVSVSCGQKRSKGELETSQSHGYVSVERAPSGALEGHSVYASFTDDGALIQVLAPIRHNEEQVFTPDEGKDFFVTSTGGLPEAGKAYSLDGKALSIPAGYGPKVSAWFGSPVWHQYVTGQISFTKFPTEKNVAGADVEFTFEITSGGGDTYKGRAGTKISR